MSSDLSHKLDQLLSTLNLSSPIERADARIHFCKAWDENQSCYITRYRWTGGVIAAISDEFMPELSTKPIIGDVLDLGDFQIVLVDRSVLGDFWYAAQIPK